MINCVRSLFLKIKNGLVRHSDKCRTNPFYGEKELLNNQDSEPDLDLNLYHFEKKASGNLCQP